MPVDNLVQVTIFKSTIAGTETDIHDFGGEDAGWGPYGSLIQANNGLLYGMTYGGGANNAGVIFSYDTSTGKETDVHDFDFNDGATPYGSLIQASNGLLYGMTYQGGANGLGNIFSFDISTGKETAIYDFGNINTDTVDGYYPQGSLIQVSDSLLYGMTTEGGANYDGIIFNYNIKTGIETDLWDFGSSVDGQYPTGSLIQASDSLLYGMTNMGGVNGAGIIFSYSISKDTEIKLYDFSNSDGQYPYGSFIQANNGLLYGMTYEGGDAGKGTIFNYNISTKTETDIWDFGSVTNDGQYPYGSLIRANDSLLYGMASGGGIYDTGTIFCYNILTNKETVVYDFGNATDGWGPDGAVVQASNGLLYGMAYAGGANSVGMIFNYNTSTRTETNLYNFTNIDGQNPYGSVIRANNNLLYGLTEYGGTNNDGMIFSYDISSGKEINLHNFGSGYDGKHPNASLIQANNGLLYGLTEDGGLYWASVGGAGTIFSYDISTGIETDLHDFYNPLTTDGYHPFGSLIQASNNLLYGMTQYGGINSIGTIFSYDISTGTETDIHDFGTGTDGGWPIGSLIRVGDSLLYGLTFGGGVDSGGIIFSYNIVTGIETDLHDFSGGTDGMYPDGSLLKASNGLLYGMTSSGGTYSTSMFNGGIIFSYNILTGMETVLHDFGNGSDGSGPNGSLIQVNDSLLYGMTAIGGIDSSGTIFTYNIIMGKETDIHDFIGIDGASPYGDLLEIDTSTTGINQLSLNNNQLSIFPNPTSGQFTIKLNDNQYGYTVEVDNVVGEKIYQSGLNNSQNIINLSSQPAGLYFVYLKSEEGREMGKVLITK